MTDHIQIYSAKSAKKTSVVFSNFKIGKIALASHLGVGDELSAIDVDPRYARQLLLREKSELAGCHYTSVVAALISAAALLPFWLKI